MGHIGIEFIEIGPDYLVATMPVDHRTVQPLGLLHGGASASLLETVASVGATWAVGKDDFCVGVELNINHIKGQAPRSGQGNRKAASTGRDHPSVEC